MYESEVFLFQTYGCRSNGHRTFAAKIAVRLALLAGIRLYKRLVTGRWLERLP